MASHLQRVHQQLGALIDQERQLQERKDRNTAARQTLEESYRRETKRLDEEAQSIDDGLAFIRSEDTKLAKQSVASLAIPTQPPFKTSHEATTVLNLTSSSTLVTLHDLGSGSANRRNKDLGRVDKPASISAQFCNPLSLKRKAEASIVGRINETAAGMAAAEPCERCVEYGIGRTCRVYIATARARYCARTKGYKCSNCVEKRAKCSIVSELKPGGRCGLPDAEDDDDEEPVPKRQRVDEK